MKPPRTPKLPSFVSGLTADLRDRGLLPVAIGLIIAILAVPILLSKGAEEPAAVVSSSAELAGDPGSASPSPVVLASTAEIRAYRERLKAFNEKDPFRPGITAEEPGAASGSGSGADVPAGAGGVSSSGEVALPENPTSPPASSGGVSPVPDPVTPTPPPVDQPPPPDPDPVEEKIFIPVVDVEVGPAGKARTQTRVTVGEYLPGPVDPIAQYFEGDFSADQATFLIAPTARAVKGDGKCRPKRGLCKALSMEEGDVAYIIDSTDGVRYKLELLAVRLVEIDPGDLDTLDVKPGFKDVRPDQFDLAPVASLG